VNGPDGREFGVPQGADQPLSPPSDHALLHTKLYVPSAPGKLLSRPRLLRQLQTAVSGKLTLVSAPAGFGKTTLVADWWTHLGHQAEGRQDEQSRPDLAWLSLDAQDNEPTRFLRYLIAALQTIADVGQTAVSLLNSLPPTPPERLLTILINDLEDRPDKLVLVLDDYHLITSPAVHALLLFLLQHMPPSLHLLLCSRSDPPLALSRWRVRGELTEIRAADLRFTPEETAVFLQQLLDNPLTATDLELLVRRTEGWIAGLQLAALSLQNLDAPAASRFIREFGGANRHVFAYLIEEVLQQQPEPVQQFLRQTAVLERLNPSLCTAVTGLAETRQRLIQLADNNLFLVPLDDQGHWFRYHPLFAESLRAALPDDERRMLHRRAADWYARHNLTHKAIYHLVQGEDDERVVAIISRNYRALLQQGKLVTVQQWLELLPPDLVQQHPHLLLACAWSQIYSSNEQECHQLLLAITAQLPGLETAAYDAIRGEMLAVQAVYASLYGQPDEAIRLANQALPLVPGEDHFVRAAVAQALGNAYRWQGQLTAATAAYEQAHFQFEHLGSVFIAEVPLYRLAQVQIMQGRLRQAQQTVEMAQQRAADAGRESLIAVSELFSHLSDLYREWNKLDDALYYAQQEIELAGQGHLQLPLVTGYLALASVQAAQGEPAAARAALSQAAAQAQHCQSPILMAQVAMQQAAFELSQKNLAPALSWAEQYAARQIQQPKDLPPALRQAANLLLARIRLAQGDLAAAEGLLVDVQTRAQQDGRMRLEIEALILRALLSQMQEQDEAAIMLLQQALTLAEPEGYIRIFVDQGTPLAGLLAQISPPSTYVNRLLAQMSSDHLPPGTAFPLYDPLTPREQEILRLVASGDTNQQIADRLFLTVGTVKGHLNHIFSKLDVQNRTQAIARARTLGLLPA
jgi:LuxR family transcriptional regulator, maltose regulon positive regulatory protein